MQRVTGQKCENPVDVAGFRIHVWTAGALACAQSILRGTGTLACAPCLLVASCQLLAALFSRYKQNTKTDYHHFRPLQHKICDPLPNHDSDLTKLRTNLTHTKREGCTLRS